MNKYEIRRKRLQQLIDERHDRKKVRFSEAHGISPSYVSRMLYPSGKKGRKRIGEDLAAQIETKEGLPSGWLSALSESPADSPAKAFKSAMKREREQDPYALINTALDLLLIVARPRREIVEKIKQEAEDSRATQEAALSKIRQG